MISYFRNLFCSQEACQPISLLLGSVPKLSDNACSALTKVVSLEEVHTALMDMDAYKALGPDRFQAGL